MEAAEAPTSIHRLAERMQDELIGVVEVPDDFINLVLYVICSPKLRQAHGADQFVLNAYLDYEKISRSNASRILSCIGENFDCFESEELCLVSVDYVARKFDSKQAAEILRRLGQSKGFYQRAAVCVGVEAFLKRSDLDEASRKDISTLGKEMRLVS